MYSCSSSMVKDSKSTDKNPQRKPQKRVYTKWYNCEMSQKTENNTSIKSQKTENNTSIKRYQYGKPYKMT